MYLVIMGPPGSGKGTHAEKVSERYKIIHISTGDMLRKCAAEGDPIAIKMINEYSSRGKLTPDDYMIDLVTKRLSKADSKKVFILEGFPRTLVQVEALKELASVNVVIQINITKEEAVFRLSGRRYCKQCGKIYNLNNSKFKPKKDKLCDICGIKLALRKDDKLKSIEKRFKVDRINSNLVRAYYKRVGLLREVDGIKSFKEVNREIIEIVEDVKKCKKTS